jgi:hypothetical protein
MIGRRLVAALIAAMLLIPAAVAGASTQRLYLRGGGIPISVLSDSQPTSSSVRNFDWLRNDDPGVTLRPGGSWNTSSSTRYQEFFLSVDGVHLSGGGSLTVWSAVADFEPDTTGALEAYLLDCNSWGGSCSLLATGSLSDDSWNAADQWSERTISFPAVDHAFGSGRMLKVRIVAGASAEDDMWIAYDSVSTPSSLTIDLGAAPAPTTTTTTTTSTTSTTSSTSTTSTTIPGSTTSTSTTSTTTPVGSTTTTPDTTTTQPGAATTTTDAPADDSTTTTAAAGAAATTVPPDAETSTTSSTIGEQPTATVTGAEPPVDGADGPVEIDRGGLVVTSDGDVSISPLAPSVRLTIGPLERLAVSFGTATETIRSTMLPALALGAFAAMLVITLFEQARRDWTQRLLTLFGRFPQTFQPLWMSLRSRMAQRT